MGSGKASTVVNIWAISDSGRHGQVVGYLIRDNAHRFWFEDLIGLPFERIDASNLPLFLKPQLIYRSCFQRDLPL